MSKATTARLAPWLTWLAGMLIAFYPTLVSGFRRVQVNHGDPRLVNYLLEHTFLWLTGRSGHESFWSPPIFHPARHVGAYTDTVVGAAPFYWLWRFSGFERGTALQLWMMTCFALNFWLAFLFLFRCLHIPRPFPWPCSCRSPPSPPWSWPTCAPRRSSAGATTGSCTARCRYGRRGSSREKTT